MQRLTSLHLNQVKFQMSRIRLKHPLQTLPLPVNLQLPPSCPAVGYLRNQHAMYKYYVILVFIILVIICFSYISKVNVDAAAFKKKAAAFKKKADKREKDFNIIRS